jgi:predicted NBD/HSP70 family sugar kinase
MDPNSVFSLPAPRVTPVLDAGFRPAVLANRAFQAKSRERGTAIGIALEQREGIVSRFRTWILPDGDSASEKNFFYLERVLKFLLWSRGGYRIHVAGHDRLAARLAAYYRDTQTGRFDSDLVGDRMFDHPIEVVAVQELPDERTLETSLGRHMKGCRIGFDLGGSDRKVAALIDGKVVFSEETVWDPYFQTDPTYHREGIMDSLRKAAAHLPRVDAIGGSAAGIYVNNQVKVASLFRGVPPGVFQPRVRDMFLEIRKAWKNIPFEVVNDGEVTALAGSMSLGRNRVLGISLGTSTAGGYVNAEGKITSWINELAFVPVDYQPRAPADEWSGDVGCGVQYLSQQCVGRLLGPAGIQTPADMRLAEKLKHVQELIAHGDARALRIYQTLGTYLGYAVAHFSDFYELENVLILGRVTSGVGGEIILDGAREVLKIEFADLADRIQFHIPGELEKRHGQAVAAASLPVIA